MQLNLGLMTRRGRVFVNACMLEGTDGTRYGFANGSFGTMNPPITIDGTEVYELSWSNVGTFIMAFGIAGNDQLTDIQTVYLTTEDNYTVTLEWDIAASAYVGTDVGAAQYLISDYVLGQQRCALIEISMPEGEILHYSFSSIERTA